MIRGALLTATVAASALLALSGPAPAQVASGPASLSQGTQVTIGPMENGLIRGGEIATRADVGKTVEVVEDRLKQQAADIQAKIAQQKIDSVDKTINWKKRRNIKRELQDPGPADKAGRKLKQSGWLAKAGTVLKAMDVVSAAARIAGHLAADDETGARAVLLNEGMKKAAELSAGAAGSLLGPAGAVVGTSVATEFHEAYVKPELDRHETLQRNKVWDERYRTAPWMDRVQVWEADGSVRTLGEDEYIDRTNGEIKVRSPADQAAHVDNLKRIWKDRTALAELDGQLKQGRIERKTYERLIQDFVARDPGQDWDPDEAAERIAEADAMRDEAERMAAEEAMREDVERAVSEEDMREEAERVAAEAARREEAERTAAEATKRGEAEREAGEEDLREAAEREAAEAAMREEAEREAIEAAMREAAERQAADDAQAEGPEIRKVTASMKTGNSMVEIVAVFDFWNVGAREPGYEGVTVSFVATSDWPQRTVERYTATGTFTGGPNGRMHLEMDGETTICQVSGGQTITCEESTAIISDPSAFHGLD